MLHKTHTANNTTDNAIQMYCMLQIILQIRICVRENTTDNAIDNLRLMLQADITSTTNRVCYRSGLLQIMLQIECQIQ